MVEYGQLYEEPIGLEKEAIGIKQAKEYTNVSKDFGCNEFKRKSND